MSLNVSKTKIVVFRNGGVLRENDKWFYHGNEIEVVNEFNYLGLLFNYNGKGVGMIRAIFGTVQDTLVKVCPTLSADLYVFVLSFVYYYYSYFSLIGFVIGYLCHLLSDLAQVWTVVSP